MTGRTTWVAHVEDDLRLVDENGSIICILKRKNAAVLLSLAKGGPKGVLREQIADRLWTNPSPDDRRASLRQALTQLKKALGEEAILADRSRCRLRPGLTIDIVQSNSLATFTDRDSVVEPTPLDGLLNFSEWLAKNEPSQLLECLRSNLEYAIHLHPQSVLHLLSEAEPRLSSSDPNRNWCYFWKGAAYIQRGVRCAAPLLREATDRAFAADDRLLMRESSYLLAICEILAGRPRRALALSDRAISVIRDRDLLHSGRFADLRSSALLHLGLKDDALMVLERRTGQGSGSKIEFAKNEALRALYTATGGDLDRAYEVNEMPYRVSCETGSKGVELICRLTSGYIEAIAQPEKGVDRLVQLIRYCKQHGFNHVALYGQETLALAYQNSRQPEQAASALKNSVSLRKSLGFRYTRWDQTRLKGLVSLN